MSDLIVVGDEMAIYIFIVHCVREIEKNKRMKERVRERKMLFHTIYFRGSEDLFCMLELFTLYQIIEISLSRQTRQKKGYQDRKRQWKKL